MCLLVERPTRVALCRARSFREAPSSVGWWCPHDAFITAMIPWLDASREDRMNQFVKLACAIETASRGRLVRAALAKLCGAPGTHSIERACTYEELANGLGLTQARAAQIVGKWAVGVRIPPSEIAQALLWLAEGKLVLDVEPQIAYTNKRRARKRRVCIYPTDEFLRALARLVASLEDARLGVQLLTAWCKHRGVEMTTTGGTLTFRRRRKFVELVQSNGTWTITRKRARPETFGTFPWLELVETLARAFPLDNLGRGEHLEFERID